jgi:HEAT repeats
MSTRKSQGKKPRRVEERLAALKALDPAAPDAAGTLRDALRSQSGILIAAAARLVAEHRLETLVPELPDAFEALREDPVQRDPGCRGKIAIARALHELDHWEDRVLVAGLTIEQREGWGTQDDMAAELRGVCGLAHAHFGRADALDVLADLLADRERTARVAAAQGLGEAGHPDAAALLRYKVRIGDPDPEVLTACVESLLQLAGGRAEDFLIGLLAKHDERAEIAAIALGGARHTGAFEPLVAWCNGCMPAQRHRIGYLALALLRHEPATEYLLGVIRERPRDAIAAAGALATFKDDAALSERIRAAAAAHDEKTRREIAGLL